MIRNVFRVAIVPVFVSLFLITSSNSAAAANGLMSSKACAAWKQNAIGAGSNTDQVYVMRGDGIVLYQWADGAYKLSSPHALWSVSKTVTTTLAAIAINQGRLKVTDRVATYLPASSRPVRTDVAQYEQLTIDDLMSMTSGLRWNERTDASAEDQSDLPLLYYSGYRDVVNYSLAQSFAASPGRVWNYSSANANLLMGVLRHIYGHAYKNMPWDNLFTPLGITSAHMEQDAAGNYISAAYIHMSPADLAKIGLLYLHDGVTRDGRRLLPVGWVARAQTPVESSLSQIRAAGQIKGEGPYSHGTFWLNTEISSDIRRPYLNAPTNIYMAEGLFGQIMAVFPDLNLVMVRTGHDASEVTGTTSIVSNLAACFGGK